MVCFLTLPSRPPCSFISSTSPSSLTCSVESQPFYYWGLLSTHYFNQSAISSLHHLHQSYGSLSSVSPIIWINVHVLLLSGRYFKLITYFLTHSLHQYIIVTFLAHHSVLAHSSTIIPSLLTPQSISRWLLAHLSTQSIYPCLFFHSYQSIYHRSPVISINRPVSTYTGPYVIACIKKCIVAMQWQRNL